MFVNLIVLLFVLCSLRHLVNTTRCKIINGTEAKFGQFPSLVALFDNYDSFLCTGSLITPFHVLTAAHCFTLARPTNVLGGDISLSKTERKRRQYKNISGVIVHPIFFADESYEFDIAIAEVQSPFGLSKELKLLELAKDTPVAGTTCLNAGWGGMKPFPDGSKPPCSNILRYQYTTVQEKDACTLPTYIPNIICTESRNTSAYFGDSGGPLICDGKHSGVLSAKIKFRNMFASVPKFYSWIEKNTNMELSDSASFRNFAAKYGRQKVIVILVGLDLFKKLYFLKTNWIFLVVF